MSAPLATYRLQFRSGVGFDEAAALVSYLAGLGVSHLYASPVFRAASDSTHGYDVADHAELDPCLGGDAAWERLVEALKGHGIGLLLDIVPNHMAASTENPWWDDILAWGPESRFAGHFDVDWSADRLLLPVLGEPYGEALAAGALELRPDRAGGSLRFGYYDHAFPMNPPACAALLRSTTDAGLQDLGRRFAALTPDGGDPEHARDAFRTTLDTPSGREMLESVIAAVNADRERLHSLHEAQHWRLGHWRLARESLTYRRFFEISELAGVRVEDPRVFRVVHERAAAMLAAGTVDGLRIDHVDGLADPKGYLEALRDSLGAPYVVVEKILMPGETLPEDWPVAGTTGYEIGRLLVGIQVDPGQAAAMTDAWGGFTGERTDFAAAVRSAKQRILGTNLAGELAGLVRLARDIAAADRTARDLGPDALRAALLALVAELPVYRSYADADGCRAADARLLGEAGTRAKLGPSIEDGRPVDFLVGLITGAAGSWDEEARLEFVRRFQQTSGPVMAKAVEDTVFYAYNRLIALNEVGSEPEPFGLSVPDFHAEVQERARTQPHGLSATATHDTKRGEDARMRIAMLAQRPQHWRRVVERWHDACADLRTTLPSGVRAPDRNDEWMLYQSLLGAWPHDMDPADGPGLEEFGERIDAFMIKAIREAKRHSTWTAPDVAYEEAASRFVRGLLRRPGMIKEMQEVFAPLLAAGAVASLAQLTLKLTLPGTPDIYQGTELWDLSLVDPDNRRPVDFDLRTRLLDEAASLSAEQALERWRSGMPKLWLLQRLLSLRNERPVLFRDGGYEPLSTSGPEADGLLAFARHAEGDLSVVVVPRLPSPDSPGSSLTGLLRGDRARVRLPETLIRGPLVDRLTGRPCPVSDGQLDPSPALKGFPVAVLCPA